MDRKKNRKRFSGFEELPSGRATTTVTPGCLCLEGGAMRGVYTNGVLDALMKHGLNFECVVGVSAGALNGFNYLSGQIGRSARMNLGYRHDPRMFGISPFLHDRSVYGFNFVFNDINDCDEIENFDEERFLNSPQRFVAVATNCETGQPVYFEKDRCDIYTAAKASASMQFLSRMVEVDGIKCMDGCASVHTPYQFALEENYSKIIAIRTRVKEYRKEIKESVWAERVYKNFPEYAASLKNADEEYNLECEEMDRLEKEGRIFVLCPSREIDVAKLETDMEKLGEWYYLGYNDMVDALPRLREYLATDAAGNGTLEGKNEKKKHKQSYKFFENRECKFYPCHSQIDEMNCMFCYCPMYTIPNCPGTPKYFMNKKKRIKDCSACTFPHVPENYDKIMNVLRK